MFALIGTVLAAADYVLETVGAGRLRLVLVVGVSLRGSGGWSHSWTWATSLVLSNAHTLAMR